MREKFNRILAISVAVIFILVIIIVLSDNPISIVGTYCAGEQNAPSATYLAFMNAGDFVMYQQHGNRKKGTYRITDKGNLTLILGKEQYSAFYDFAKNIVLYLPSNNPITFEKISSTPMIIN